MSERGAPRTIPVVATAGDLDGDALAGHIRHVLEQGAPSFLTGRRWFGDKDRRIERGSLFDVTVVSAGPDYFAPALLGIEFSDGGSASYFLPLVITLEALPDEATLGLVQHETDRWRIVEALSVPRFQTWLLERLAAPATMPMRAGTLAFEPTSMLARYLAAARTGGSRAITGEQSNTSIVYGDAAILKAFRKLQPGVNPDIEIGAHLTEQTEFRHVPPLLGSIHYRPDQGEAVSIGVLQTFVPSTGDAWTMTVAEITALAKRGESQPESDDGFSDSIRWASILGQRTGELHVALAAGGRDAAFRPEQVGPADIQGWKSALVQAAGDRRTELDRIGSSLGDPALIDSARSRLAASTIGEIATGFDSLDGTSRIRVHGDYHLGQVLRTVDGDVMILDFEGEPSRPISERRSKTSALKDVAGMLRSFGYARVAASMALAREGVRTPHHLLHSWETAAREAFLASYRTTTRDAAVPLIPTDAGSFGRALRAWETDKALYEVHYELNNRPDWLGHVLETLV